jgi:hypothetical protein
VSGHVYACHNKPRPTAATTHDAQSGWRQYEERDAIVRVPVYELVPHRMSTACQYDKSQTDKACAGCQHIQRDECKHGTPYRYSCDQCHAEFRVTNERKV